LQKKSGNLKDIGVSLNNIGVVYYHLYNYEKALEYFNRILDESYPCSFKDALYINIGLCYTELHDFPAAKKFIDNGLNLCAPNCSQEIIMQGKFALGVSLFYSKKPKEAEEYFLKAIDIARQQQAKSLELRAVMSLSRLWQQQGKKQEAHQMLADIYGWFTEGFDTKDLQEAKALLDELAEGQ